MNDHEFRSHAADLQRFAEQCIRSFSELTTAAYDFREAVRFYTEGCRAAAQRDDAGHDSEPGSAVRRGAAAHGSSVREAAEGVDEREPRVVAAALDEQPKCSAVGPLKYEQQGMADIEAGAGAGEEAGLASRAKVKACLPSHALAGQRRYERLPDTSDVVKLFKDRKKVRLVMYYDELRAYCEDNGIAKVTRKGARYLAHCVGAEFKKAHDCTYVIWP